MPSSRLKHSSTASRPIGIDGLRAASVRSSTGFARAIFSVIGTIAISVLTSLGQCYSRGANCIFAVPRNLSELVENLLL